MRIQHNITALNSYRNLGINNKNVAGNLEKLSSGYAINRAGDDAAGLAISEKMRAQIQGLETAQKNAEDGISLVQTAEGALTEVHSMLNRMVELATQSANGTYTDDDRNKLQSEIESLTQEIDRISEGTNFNGLNLLDGSMGAVSSSDFTAATGATGASITMNLGVDLNELAEGDTITLFGKTIEVGAAGATATGVIGAGEITTSNLIEALGDVKIGEYTIGDTASSSAIKLGFASGKITLTSHTGAADIKALTDVADTLVAGVSTSKSGLILQVGDTADDFQKVNVSVNNMNAKTLGIDDLDISTQDGAKAAIASIKDAIDAVSTTRSNMGALQNRLDHTINNLGVTTENMTAAEARIRDVDMAKEMMEYTKNNILVQASQSMLAQANQVPQSVLQLLQ